MAMATLRHNGKSKRIQILGELAGSPTLEPLTVTENGEYTPGEGVDGFSEVLVDVLTGGGLPDGISAVATGTFTVANKTGMTIEHNLGVVPKVFMVFSENQWFYGVAGNVLLLYGAVRFALANDSEYISAWGTRNYPGTLANGQLVTITETTASIEPGTNTYGYFSPTQNTTENGDPEQLVYRWYAIA